MAILTEQEKQALLAEYAKGKQVALGRYVGQDIAWRVLEERTRILNTRVDSPLNPKYYTNGGMGSVDKLFALSLGEQLICPPARTGRPASGGGCALPAATCSAPSVLIRTVLSMTPGSTLTIRTAASGRPCGSSCGYDTVGTYRAISGKLPKVR